MLAERVCLPELRGLARAVPGVPPRRVLEARDGAICSTGSAGDTCPTARPRALPLPDVGPGWPRMPTQATARPRRRTRPSRLPVALWVNVGESASAEPLSGDP